jgi:hypothetical protein
MPKWRDNRDGEDRELDATAAYWKEISDDTSSSVILRPAVSITGLGTAPPPGSRVTSIPAALVTQDGVEVRAGDVVSVGGPDSGRQAKVLDPAPQENGGILVQEVFTADPADLGCVMREQRIIVELSASAARDMVSQMGTASDATAEVEKIVGGLQEAVAEQ